MTHPWEDPNLMPLYHVQLETRDLIVSYEIATDNYDAVEVYVGFAAERHGLPKLLQRRLWRQPLPAGPVHHHF